MKMNLMTMELMKRKIMLMVWKEKRKTEKNQSMDNLE
jgi:hypothetical protein